MNHVSQMNRVFKQSHKIENNTYMWSKKKIKTRLNIEKKQNHMENKMCKKKLRIKVK